MSGLSTATAVPIDSLGALLGGAPDGGTRGPTPPSSSPSSFGAALALAAQTLDVSSETRAPATLDALDVSDVAVLQTCAFVRLPAEPAGDAQAIADAELSVAIADLAVPTGPPSEALPNEAAPNEAASTIPNAVTPAVATPNGAATADESLPQASDAEVAIVPGALASAAPLRAGDNAPATPAPAPAPATAVVAPAAAALAVAPEAPVIREDVAPVPSSRGASDADALPATLPAAPATKDGAARQDTAATPLPAAVSSTVAATPGVTISPPIASLTGTTESVATPRAVAAQVAPVVLSIVQRPVGSHQLTMTVNPDSLGPVTVRAHISAGGEVRVELLGSTDAGREALRTIVTDLRRDLAAVMPHASLSLGSHSATESGSPDRGAQPGAGGTPNDQTGERERGRAPADPRSAVGDVGHGIPRILPTTTRAVSGEGLDIFA